jgi:hypothetical protein
MNAADFIEPTPGEMPRRSDRTPALRGAAGDRRERIGFIGNCQTELLHRAFRDAVPASRFATFYHFFDVAETTREAARAEIAACDLLCLQDIQDLEQYPLRDAIRRDTRIVRFPFLRFAAPWPYDDFNGLRDTAARAQDDPSRHTVTYYDGVLGRLRRSVPDPQARFLVYRTLALEGIVDPVRVLDFETRRLEALDEKFACTIGRFILDNFREAQLFYTVNRPCGSLLAIVLDMIFKAVDVDPELSPDTDLDELRSIQCPVHPLVAQKLGIAWAHEARLYLIEDRQVTFDDHVRDYIARYG